MMSRPLIGILGGMGPAATAEFLYKLTQATAAQTDQEHYESIIWCKTPIPDRTKHLLAQSDKPLIPIKQGLEDLIEWGADLLVVPCNTAHAFIDQFIDELPVPLVHIVHATLDQAQSISPDGAWLTATSGTIASELYQKAAEKRGYTLYLPSSHQQERIMNCVDLVKAGCFDEAGATYRAVADELYNDRPLVALTACTELPLAFDHSGLPAHRSVSSINALAHATVQQAQKMTQHHQMSE